MAHTKDGKLAFLRKHPIYLASIIGLLISAGIFTSTLFLFPATIATMLTIGNAVILGLPITMGLSACWVVNSLTDNPREAPFIAITSFFVMLGAILTTGLVGTLAASAAPATLIGFCGLLVTAVGSAISGCVCQTAIHWKQSTSQVKQPAKSFLPEATIPVANNSNSTAILAALPPAATKMANANLAVIPIIHVMKNPEPPTENPVSRSQLPTLENESQNANRP